MMSIHENMKMIMVRHECWYILEAKEGASINMWHKRMDMNKDKSV